MEGTGESKPLLCRTPLLEDSLLARLSEAWQSQGAPIADHLAPGLTDEEIDEITEPLGLRLSLEARVWWGWHDGVPANPNGGVTPERWIGPVGEYLPLQDAVDVYTEERKIFADILGGDPEPCRPAAYLPVTYSSGPIFCDCSVPAGAPSPIYRTHTHAIPEDELAQPVTQSFGEMVLWWIEALNEGAWRWDPDRGSWTVNPEKLPDERAASGIV